MQMCKLYIVKVTKFADSISGMRISHCENPISKKHESFHSFLIEKSNIKFTKVKN